MKIDMIKFGNLLISRPAGKDAWLGMQQSLKEINPQEEVILDFKDVSVLTPSWLDEFLTPLKVKFKHVKIQHAAKGVVQETLEFLENLHRKK